MQFAKISPQLIISSRSEYQVGNQHRIAERKKQRANVFYLPLSTAPVVQMVGLSQQAMFAAGNVSHPRGLVRATLTFSARIRSVRQFSEQVGIRRPHLTDNWRTACWGNRTRDLPVMNRVGPHRRAALLPPWRSALLITAACWPPNGAVGRENVSGPDDLFLFICRFSSHLITRRSAEEYIHDMHYGGVVVSEKWILILPPFFTLFPK